MPCHINRDDLVELTKSAVPTFGEVELIVIDDASPVGGGYLRSIADIYVRNKENLGYGKSVNRGLKLATNSLVAIANNDIRVSPNWQDVAKNVLGMHPKAYSCHFRMTDYDVPFEYGEQILYEGKERWCHASFFVIDRSKLNLLYDEEYVNTYDDWDYFQSVRSKGFKQAYTDIASFQHVHSATIPSLPKHTERNESNRQYFRSKWGAYAEELFERDFPDQVRLDYKSGFDLGK